MIMTHECPCDHVLCYGDSVVYNGYLALAMIWHKHNAIMAYDNSSGSSSSFIVILSTHQSHHPSTFFFPLNHRYIILNINIIIIYL